MCGQCPVDDFIGQTFPTPKGGVLTIVGDNGLKGNKKRYEFKCSVCSKDPRLPKTFYASKNSIMDGHISCGCSSRYRDDGEISVYLGDKSKTRYGNILTIVGHNGLVKNKKRYFVECSVCSLKERYTKHFEIPLSDFRNGNKTPCECSNRMKKKESQIVYDAKELCKSRGYEYIRFVNKISANSKIIYFCKDHGEQIQSLGKMKQGQSCPQCSLGLTSERNRKPEDLVIEEIKEKCVEHDIEFVKIINYKNKSSKFHYICKTHGLKTGVISSILYNDSGCSECGVERSSESKRIKDPENLIHNRCKETNSKFVGYLGGNFVSSRETKVIISCNKHGDQSVNFSRFINGGNFCTQCGIESIKDKLRNPNAENTVNEICKKEEYEYLGFPDGYKNVNSKFEYICNIHGKQTSSYDKFVHGGSRCPSCATSGYQPSKPGHLYVTNWINYNKDTNEFFKIGITNFLEQRIKQQARKTSYKPHQLIVFKFEDGSIPQELERLTKPYRQDMEHPIITPDEFADGTTEILQNWIDIIKILPELIDTIREKGYTPEIEVGKRLYNKLIKLDKDQMAKVILDHLYK
ncbi:hypothetical protein [Aeromonas phage AS-zj]|uniref:CapR homology domain-containing protein n=1 Tax=Aeromonas phage AS-zj TaxID=2024208 RepID=A0A223LF14_9CAUD|nr:endonuclease [Aeromonas phage AS-zj]ASU00341.1 hypothetical protein [Aeromonas phage AS-zj]